MVQEQVPFASSRDSATVSAVLDLDFEGLLALVGDLSLWESPHMLHFNQPAQNQSHELNLQQRRLERMSEDRKLDKLKAQLQAMIRQQQQLALLAHAS
jgi:hypothetical protein